MSGATRLKHARKQARWDARIAQEARQDDANGDEHRRAAAHAHVMTHHALEMDTPDAHRAAAGAHEKIAEMHNECAEEMDAEEAPEASSEASGSKTSKGRKKPNA